MDERLDTQESEAQPKNPGVVRRFMARLSMGRKPEQQAPPKTPLEAAAEEAFNVTYGHATSGLRSVGMNPEARKAYDDFVARQQAALRSQLHSATAKGPDGRELVPESLKKAKEDYIENNRPKARQVGDLTLQARFAMTGQGKRTVVLDVSKEPYKQNPDKKLFDWGVTRKLYEALGVDGPQGTDPELRKTDRSVDQSRSRHVIPTDFGITVVESWRGGTLHDLTKGSSGFDIPEGLSGTQPYGEVHLLEFVPVAEPKPVVPAA